MSNEINKDGFGNFRRKIVSITSMLLLSFRFEVWRRIIGRNRSVRFQEWIFPNTSKISKFNIGNTECVPEILLK